MLNGRWTVFVVSRCFYVNILTAIMDYLPLNPSKNELRLISITPNLLANQLSIDPTEVYPSIPNDIIHCRLEHVSLDDLVSTQLWQGHREGDQPSPFNWNDTSSVPASAATPPWRFIWGDYFALSYAWGDLSRKSNILVNGHLMTVGSNLEAPLRAIRQKQPVQKGYKIWIDALCINQQDIVERGEQVKRMRDIYKQAHDVLVWLGPEEDDSGKAMDLIRTLSHSHRSGQHESLGAQLRQKRTLLFPGAWIAVSQLLDRAYWDRLWVLQEICMGGAQTPILCGRQAITWDDLYRATYLFCTTHNIDIVFSLIDEERQNAGLSSAGLKRNKIIHLQYEQAIQTSGGELQIMPLLDLGRKSLASDPKDKVYGLLGLMNPSVIYHLIADYRNTVPEIYTSFAKAMIIASTLCFFIIFYCLSFQEKGLLTLTFYVKIIVWRFLNNAHARHLICHLGYLTGQICSISVCLVVAQLITPPKA